MEKAIAKFRAFNRFYTPIIGLLDQHFLDSEFSLTEARILFELNYAAGGITAKALIAQLQLDKGYLSRILKQFEKKQLVCKEKSELDGRAILLSLTEKGEKVFNALNNASEKQAADVLRSVPTEEVGMLIDYMDGIKKILGNIKLK